MKWSELGQILHRPGTLLYKKKLEKLLPIFLFFTHYKKKFIYPDQVGHSSIKTFRNYKKKIFLRKYQKNFSATIKKELRKIKNK